MEIRLKIFAAILLYVAIPGQLIAEASNSKLKIDCSKTIAVWKFIVQTQPVIVSSTKKELSEARAQADSIAIRKLEQELKEASANLEAAKTLVKFENLDLHAMLVEADKGNATVKEVMGECFDENKLYSEAVKWYRKAAEQGNASAQFNLGVKYDKGEGVAKDPAEAVKWYRKAAEQGNASAQFNLGLSYDKGEGVAKDPAEAVKWYLKVGDTRSDAAFNLARIYFSGETGVRSDAEGTKWIRHAANLGDESAVKYVQLWGSARSGDIELIKQLGNMHLYALKDPIGSIAWYSKAGDKGDGDAYFRIGWLYLKGMRSLTKDTALSASYFRKAAELRNARAAEELAGLYERGDGVSKDASQAKLWMTKACDLGRTSACGKAN